MKGYALIGELTNDNSGYSKWGLARQDGKSWFVKEFLSPVYPMDASVLTPERMAQRRAACTRFADERTELYRAVNRAACGGVVRIRDYFRSGSRYYIVTELLKNTFSDPQRVAALPEGERVLLCRLIAYALCRLHRQGVVHFDIKPSNILICTNARGVHVPKLIDFDGSFLQENPPKAGQEVTGDLTYLAPETLLLMQGEDVTVGPAADVFALGLVLHQYWCGCLPTLSEGMDYPFEEVLERGSLRLDPALRPSLAALIGSMLSRQPEDRPTMEQVLHALTPAGLRRTDTPAAAPETPAPKSPAPEAPVPEAPTAPWFRRAGDL